MGSKLDVILSQCLSSSRSHELSLISHLLQDPQQSKPTKQQQVKIILLTSYTGNQSNASKTNPDQSDGSKTSSDQLGASTSSPKQSTALCGDILQTLVHLTSQVNVASLVASLLPRISKYVMGELWGKVEDKVGDKTEDKEENKLEDKVEGTVEDKMWLVHSYSHCVTIVTFPNLGDHLDEVLPVALRCVDHCEVWVKVRGIALLHHITTEVNATELTWYNRSDVMYDAMFTCLYTADVEVLEVLLPALVSLLHVSDAGRGDAVMGVILKRMSIEQRWQWRRCYASNLPAYVRCLGITTLRHINVILDVVSSHLEVGGQAGEVFKVGLITTVREVVRECWPRMGRHAARVVTIMLRVLCEEEAVMEEQEDEITKSITTCLTTLALAAPMETREILRDVKCHGVGVSARCDRVVEAVWRIVEK